MLKLKRHIGFFTMFFVIMFSLSAQERTSYERSADFLFDICKYITWPDETGLNEFSIGILEPSNGSQMFLSTQKMASIKGNLKNKKIVVKEFTSIDEVDGVQVVYVNKFSGFDITELLMKVRTKPILIASENYEFDKSMINFIEDEKGKMRFEYNQGRLDKAGFTANPLFIGLAKTKADWEGLYERIDVLLQKEKETVKQQSDIIRNQKKEIDEQASKIAGQKEEIRIQQAEIDKQRSELELLIKDIRSKRDELVAKNNILNEQQLAIDNQKEEITKQEASIDAKNAILAQKADEILKQEEKIEIQNATIDDQLKAIEKQQLILYFLIVVALLTAVAGYFMFRSYLIKKKANKLLQLKNEEIMKQNVEIKKAKEEIEAQHAEIEKQRDILAVQNEELMQAKEEIEAQRDEIEDQRDEILLQKETVTHQKEEIMDSIHYASRIQRAILPPKIFIEAVMPEEHFILNKPRDIVSGDFYWIGQQKDEAVFIAADCTGHGVPGAFMSMLGVSFLNEIVNNRKITTANHILNELKSYVVRALHQTGKEDSSKDGMDMALCVLNKKTLHLQYAGANNPLYIVSPIDESLDIVRNNAPYNLTDSEEKKCLDNGEYKLFEIKADKMPIGIYSEDHESFSLVEIILNPGNSFYIFSDGYADQFGGPQQKKFKYKPFKQLLLELQNTPMPSQAGILDKTIEDWKGDLEQVDDILVFGVKI